MVAADRSTAAGGQQPRIVSGVAGRVSGPHKAARIDLLMDLIEADEVCEVVSHFMRNHGLRQADLARILGSRSPAYELLPGKRKLSMAEARKIQQAWLIPPEALIR